VRKLGLVSENQWQLYVGGKISALPTLPNNIPRTPWFVYRDNGWTSIGDFLGTNQVAPRLKQYRTYEGAEGFARSLKLTRKEDWIAYSKGEMPYLPPLPVDIPASPPRTYKRIKNGGKWNSWSNFLGSGRLSNQDKSKKRIPYKEAHKFAISLNLKTANEWRQYIKGKFENLPPLPQNLPRKPDAIYDEWIDWPTFLGNKEISKFNSRRDFWYFEVAREFVRKLSLKNQKDWHNYCAGKLAYLPEKPSQIPSNPGKKYRSKGWINLEDWLGTHKQT
jgi:hypothetical protein